MFLKKVILENFCGFPRQFQADFDQFTVLVGPNNGGKTTLLRAIKFVIDAFRLYFGDAHEPNLGQLVNNNWQVELQSAANRLGVQDLHQFYYGRSRHGPAAVTLEFLSP
ncbi:MAG TPA: AAA family ATPase, partial [Gemmataceae bacterium]|nr:AAA family ATPase [Gemmataceae bacterium]